MGDEEMARQFAQMQQAMQQMNQRMEAQQVQGEQILAQLKAAGFAAESV